MNILKHIFPIVFALLITLFAVPKPGTPQFPFPQTQFSWIIDLIVWFSIIYVLYYFVWRLILNNAKSKTDKMILLSLMVLLILINKPPFEAPLALMKLVKWLAGITLYFSTYFTLFLFFKGAYKVFFPKNELSFETGKQNIISAAINLFILIIFIFAAAFISAFL